MPMDDPGMELPNKSPSNTGNHSPPTKVAQKQQQTVSLFRLFAFADSFDYLLMFVGTLGAVAHGSALPVFNLSFGRIVDTLGNHNYTSDERANFVGQHAVVLVYLGLACLGAAWAEVACWMYTGSRQAAKIRIRYLEAILKQDIGFFDTDAHTGTIIDSIATDTIHIQEAISEKMGTYLNYTGAWVTSFIIGFSVVWRIAFVTLSVVPALSVAAGVYNHTFTKIAIQSQEAYSAAGTIAEQAMAQIRTVYSFVGETKALESYKQALKRTVKLGYKGGLGKGLGIGSYWTVLLLSWSLIMWYTSTLVLSGQTNGGKAITTMFCLLWGGITLGQSFGVLATFSQGKAAATRVFEMIDRKPKISSGPKILSRVKGQLELRNVLFSYPSRPNVIIFKDFSLHIPSGKTMAIVGGSGSGKSTIVSLIERFYDPISGQVLLDGHDIRKLKLTWLRDQIGLVNQEPVLFATSIFENILYGKSDSNIKEVEAAAKAANAHTYISALPDGYDTQVGERGVQLSGGQKQRVAIARAMLRNPKILLLDEATSALDVASERVVQTALEQLMVGRTTIVIAHRLSTIREVDTIAVVQGGEIIEQGTHDELMAKGESGSYVKLVRLQEMSQDIGGTVSRERRHGASPSGVAQRRSTSRHASPAMRYPAQSPRRLSTQSPMRLSTQSPIMLSSPFDISLSARSSNVSPYSILVATENNDENDVNVHQGSGYYWRLAKLNAPEWPFAILGSLGSILVGTINPFNALLISEMLNTFYLTDHHKLKTQVSKFCILFAVAGALTPVFFVLQNYYFAIVGENLTKRVREQMFKAMLQNEVAWFDRDENNSIGLASRLASDAANVCASLGGSLALLIQNLSIIATATIISSLVCWRMTLVALAILPILVISYLGERLFANGFSVDLMTAYARASIIIGEAVGNIRTVAAFSSSEKVLKLVANELREPEKRSFMRGNIAGSFFGAVQGLTYCSYALTLWYGSTLVKKGDCDFGGVIRVFMVFFLSGIAMGESLAVAQDLTKADKAFNSVFEILDRETMIQTDDKDSMEVTRLKGKIEFKNVQFAYPTRPEVIIFNGLDLRVDAGKSLALVGSSGSGKSSIISLIERFYDPLSGRVLIDGHDIRQINLRSLRRHVGLVQQEPALFATTIYDNILYGRQGARQFEVQEAAKAANAHTFISALPDGYKTQVGERGVQLSGGQKQRLAIARGVLKDPSILLLDEATSALDTATEKVVQEALDKLMAKRTTVIVAHRMSTVKNADTIAVLQNGCIIEQGSHTTLMANPHGAYVRLVKLQQHTNSNT